MNISQVRFSQLNAKILSYFNALVEYGVENFEPIVIPFWRIAEQNGSKSEFPCPFQCYIKICRK